jgi:hypothetical protein
MTLVCREEMRGSGAWSVQIRPDAHGALESSSRRRGHPVTLRCNTGKILCVNRAGAV